MSMPRKSSDAVKEKIRVFPEKKIPEAVPSAPSVELATETLETSRGPEQPIGPETAVSEIAPPAAVTPAVPIPSAYAQKDRLTQQIESVLEEDLTDLFLTMNPVAQQAFKAQGEETISKIRLLLSAATINTKKIFLLIRDWLKLIPGVNRFFLEQEAKIKTDKIVHL